MIADGATSYWRLGEAAGAAVADVKGVMPQTLTGAYARAAPGLLVNDPTDKATDFQGGQANPGFTVDFSGLVRCSMEAWFKADTWAPSWINNVCGIEEVSSNAMFLRIGTGGGGGEGLPQFLVQANGFRVAQGPTALLVGTRYHIVGTIDNALNATLYVNGVSVSTGNTAYPATALGYFSIGGGAVAGRTFDGVIDEVALYSGITLTPAQVLAHYNLGITAPIVAMPSLGGRGKPPPATRPPAEFWPEPKPIPAGRHRINKGLGGI